MNSGFIINPGSLVRVRQVSTDGAVGYSSCCGSPVRYIDPATRFTGSVTADEAIGNIQGTTGDINTPTIAFRRPIKITYN